MLFVDGRGVAQFKKSSTEVAETPKVLMEGSTILMMTVRIVIMMMIMLSNPHNVACINTFLITIALTGR